MGQPRKQRRRRDAGRARGEPIKEAVLQKTLEELATHGVDNLSVERIARSAEVNKTSVYRRWPTREALVAAALERVLLDLSGKLEDTGSLRGDLLSLAKTVAIFLDQPVGRALASAAMTGNASSQIAALAQSSLLEEARRPAEALVMRAAARGEWRALPHPEVVLSALVGGILHRLLLERAPVTGPWLTSLVDVLARGLAASPAT